MLSSLSVAILAQGVAAPLLERPTQPDPGSGDTFRWGGRTYLIGTNPTCALYLYLLMGLGVAFGRAASKPKAQGYRLGNLSG